MAARNSALIKYLPSLQANAFHHRLNYKKKYSPPWERWKETIQESYASRKGEAIDSLSNKVAWLPSRDSFWFCDTRKCRGCDHSCNRAIFTSSSFCCFLPIDSAVMAWQMCFVHLVCRVRRATCISYYFPDESRGTAKDFRGFSGISLQKSLLLFKGCLLGLLLHNNQKQK